MDVGSIIAVGHAGGVPDLVLSGLVTANLAGRSVHAGSFYKGVTGIVRVEVTISRKGVCKSRGLVLVT